MWVNEQTIIRISYKLYISIYAKNSKFIASDNLTKGERTMRKKWKLSVLLMVICVMAFGITASAETKTFQFFVRPTEYDTGNWTAVKADDEQTAYITPTAISGSGRIWVAVYDAGCSTQYTVNVGIRPGETYRHTTGYYLTGTPGITYRLFGGDSEWEVTSATFTVSGRWTP